MLTSCIIIFLITSINCCHLIFPTFFGWHTCLNAKWTFWPIYDPNLATMRGAQRLFPTHFQKIFWDRGVFSEHKINYLKGSFWHVIVFLKRQLEPVQSFTDLIFRFRTRYKNIWTFHGVWIYSQLRIACYFWQKT